MSSLIRRRWGNVSRRPRPHPRDLPVTLFPFPSCRFQPDAASQTDVRAQEPDMRFRHRLHHQRHAYRGQSSAAERHEIGKAPSTVISRLLDEQWPGRQNNNKIFEKTIALLSNRHTRLQDNGGQPGTRHVQGRQHPAGAVTEIHIIVRHPTFSFH